MAILSVTATQPAGLSSILPSVVYILTSDTYAQVTATGYLNQEKQNGFTFNNQQMALVYTSDEGPVWLKVVITYSGSSVLNTVVSLVAPDVEGGGVPFINTVPETSATPGTVRAITGAVTDTASVITSGNLVGVRGAVTMVGASGGFFYGVQGKLIPSGVLSGSSWSASVFGQFDLTNATVNAGQTAPVWADYGANGGTFTNVTGMRMFSGTNTISSLTLFAMDYRYGKATNLFELDGSSSTYISTGAATPSGDLKKIAISIDGVTHYILAAAVWS